MLDSYFVAPKTLRRLRSGTFGPYLDDFAEELKGRGYSRWTAVKYLRSAAHLGHFVELQDIALEAVSEGTLDSYRQHLLRCRCPRPFSEKVNPHAFCGAKLFVDHLRAAGIVADVIAKQAEPDPPLIDSFGHWLQQHRGVSAHTRRQHCRRAADFLRCHGDDPSGYDARRIREFFVMRQCTSSKGSAQALAGSLRAFLRFLIVQGLCPTGLDQAVPAVAGWRLASLPRGLAASEVAQLLAACNGKSVARIRDRAIILLLVRLGLRAGDVAELRLTDIDWKDSSFVVSGKSRRQVRLPLPQEVGDALLSYLECRPAANTVRVFLRVIAPIGPFRGGGSVSSVVKGAMRRAGVTAPATGAHVLRHTAAREMLRQGVSLYEIGSLLRHRSIETTAHYYAKVDRGLLEKVAQPWPEMLR